jgi:hypothetical protein
MYRYTRSKVLNFALLTLVALLLTIPGHVAAQSSDADLDQLLNSGAIIEVVTAELAGSGKPGAQPDQPAKVLLSSLALQSEADADAAASGSDAPATLTAYVTRVWATNAYGQTQSRFQRGEALNHHVEAYNGGRRSQQARVMIDSYKVGCFEIVPGGCSQRLYSGYVTLQPGANQFRLPTQVSTTAPDGARVVTACLNEDGDTCAENEIVIGNGQSGASCSGTPMQLDRTYVGSISNYDDADWYCLDQPNFPLTIRMADRGASTLDAFLEVYGPDGELLNDPHREDDSGAGHNALSVLDMMQTNIIPGPIDLPQFVRIKATRYPGQGSYGTYALRVDQGSRAGIGDVNMDCAVNVLDRGIMLDAIGQSAPDWSEFRHADMDMNGVVNAADWALWLTPWYDSLASTCDDF